MADTQHRVCAVSRKEGREERVAEEGGERMNCRAEGKKWGVKKRRRKRGKEGRKEGGEGNRKRVLLRRGWTWKKRDSWESPLSTHASDKLANPVDTIGARLCLGADQGSGQE